MGIVAEPLPLSGMHPFKWPFILTVLVHEGKDVRRINTPLAQRFYDKRFLGMGKDVVPSLAFRADDVALIGLVLIPYVAATAGIR